MLVSLDVATTVCIFLIRGSNGGSFQTCSNKVFLKFSWQNGNSYKVNRRAEYYTMHKFIDNFFAQSEINSQRLKLFCNNKEVDKRPFPCDGQFVKLKPVVSRVYIRLDQWSLEGC